MHIAVAGNIGAGKTTLTRLLSKHYKWEAHFEDVVENPYLDDFYNQMERWSFNLQIYFLNSRYRQILQIKASGKDPNLVNQIHKRGREYENTISIDYLSRLNERYEAWVHGYEKGNLLIINVDELDFVDKPEDLGSVINKIDAEINGLF